MDKTSTLWNIGPHMTHELVIQGMREADALGMSLKQAQVVAAVAA